jgi:signal transduction histidine kinase
VELKIKPLDMDALIRKVLDSISFQIKGVGASVDVTPLPPCLGDEDQINQVFTNLLGNAVKYLDPARPGRIAVCGHTENDSSIYSVSDNGIGIPAAHHAAIFELFHRVDPYSPVAGEGLGLTTVKQIVTRHNGKIWLESRQGEGSCFFVALPLPSASPADLTRTPPATEERNCRALKNLP